MRLSEKVRGGGYSWPSDDEGVYVDTKRLADDIEKLERHCRIAGLKEAERICEGTPEPSMERAGYWCATSAGDASMSIQRRIKALEDGDPV